MRNRRSKAGETLTETLVAMLIVGLSSVLFLTMVLTSARIFQRAKDEYENIYNGISIAEAQGSPEGQGSPLGNNGVPGEITVDGVEDITVRVNWYGSKDCVLSYKVQ